MLRNRFTQLSILLLLSAVTTVAIAAPPPGKGGGGGGGGCGDVFGDLIHILRADTGQPILAQRWIEMPKGEPGYGWGYCPIAVDEAGNELGFAPLSCDVAEADLEAVVETDYFGRLSGGRTKERNNRMHFNEVISNIQMAGSVGLDETGRLLLGYDCVNLNDCAEWGTIDSPMENMSLYTRLMKYGHFQTDPLEEDMWAHGDPAAGIQYHPALAEEDWAKFQPSVRFLLPGNGTLFCDTADCASPEYLSYEDFVAAAAALGGAANKTGKITVDLVQYMNRILKIAKDTEASLSTADTLPALVRVCDVEGDLDPDDETQEEPKYSNCRDDVEAGPGLDNYDLFSDVQEMFVDFAEASYDRTAWRDTFVDVIGPLPDDNNPNTARPWMEVNGVSMLGWLALRNGEPPPEPIADLNGFVAAASDTLRSIEFVHNYEIPEDLGWDFVSSGVKVKLKVKNK